MRQTRYTLIELLISMGIFAMMMLLLLNFFSKYQDFVYRAGLRNDRVADTQALFAQVERDLKSVLIISAADAQDSQGLSVGVSPESTSGVVTGLSLYTRSVFKSEQETGLGGLTRLKYQFEPDAATPGAGKINRYPVSATGKTIAELNAGDPAFTSTKDTVIAGVNAFTMTFYMSKSDFLNGISAVPAANSTGIYAVFLKLTVQDPNPDIPAAIKASNQLTFTKLIIPQN